MIASLQDRSILWKASRFPNCQQGPSTTLCNREALQVAPFRALIKSTQTVADQASRRQPRRSALALLISWLCEGHRNVRLVSAPAVPLPRPFLSGLQSQLKQALTVPAGMTLMPGVHAGHCQGVHDLLAGDWLFGSGQKCVC